MVAMSQIAVDEETTKALFLFNKYIDDAAEKAKGERAVAKAERAKEEAAALVRKLNGNPNASAEEKSDADAAYRAAVDELAARQADPFGESTAAPTEEASTEEASTEEASTEEADAVATPKEDASATAEATPEAEAAAPEATPEAEAAAPEAAPEAETPAPEAAAEAEAPAAEAAPAPSDEEE